MADFMNVTQILDELEARAIRIRVEGEGIELVGPRGALTPELAEEIRRRKHELVEVLSLQGWPEASLDAVREFRVPHARLYPLVGRPVATRLGRGRLVEVLPDRAEVRVRGRVVAFLPSEIRPPGVEASHDEPFETVH